MRLPAHVLLLLLSAAALSCLARTEAEDPLPRAVLEAGQFASGDGRTRIVRVTVLVERDLAEARRWFLEEDRLERWLAEEVSLPLEVGAPVELAWPTRGLAVTGEVEELVPGSHLTLRLDPFAGAPESRLRLSANEAPGGVRVRLEQWPFAGDPTGEAAADRQWRAWFRALQVLRAALERGLPTTPR